MRQLLVILLALSFVPFFLLFGQLPDSTKPSTFPDPINTEADLSTSALPPAEAARGFSVPPGFQVNDFAAEPDVQNPIAMAWDARGRLWVAENYTYADRTKKFDLSLRDRVLIFEDVDGDGRFDKRTVFTDDVQMLTSLEIGNGGVWLMTPPQLVFVPDQNGDDRPDGAPIVMLDGFTPSTDNHHTFGNGLKWGPDGWLYGRCGASSPGRLGIPGTPDEKRVPLFGGVWRFRPRSDSVFLSGGHKSPGSAVSGSVGRSTHLTGGLTSPGQKEVVQKDIGIVEVLSHGTTNPWGMDWNEHGEAFFINTVNGHLWHLIPGAHFRRPHSEDPNPYVFNTIDTHADHYHWDTGKSWMDSRKATGEHDRLGGGHAHSGATIYLGDNWPDAYRGRLLTLNLHGRRVNVERLEPLGCGYAGRHEPDILQAADTWFRGIDLSYGPDGAVYILDWSDTGECHEATGVHRKSGRIFRVSFQSESPIAKPRSPHESPLDLSKLESGELVGLHGHQNEWFTRQARRVLADRLGELNSESARTDVCTRLRTMFEQDTSLVVKLRALHTLSVLKGADQTYVLKQLSHENEHVRAWAIRFATQDWPLDTILGQPHPEAADVLRSLESDQTPGRITRKTFVEKFIDMAARDESGLVRLNLASTLQRLPLNERLMLAKPLAARSSDAEDHNLPLMIWYGLMPITVPKTPPVPATDNDTLIEMAKFARDCRLPETRQLISRRLGEMIDEHPRAVDRLLDSGIDESTLKQVLQGLVQGFAGRHKLKAPTTWDSVHSRIAKSEDTELQTLVRDLSVLFGDGRALDEVERIALNEKAELPARRAALKTLIDNRAPNRRRICEQLLAVRFLNTTAIDGLTEFDDPSIGEKLAQNYRNFFLVDRPSVIDALASRPSFAKPLLNQIATGKIPRTDVTAIHARQIRSFNNADLTKQLTHVWGELRDSPADKESLIGTLKTQLTPETLASADKSQGRALFAKVCGNCHRLYGHGGQIGPDLTGAGRQNLDYVLLNMVDPSAAVGADYRMSVIAMKDGRVLNGIVASRTDRVLTLQTAKDRLTIEKSDIEEEHASSLSLMPEGQLQQMTPIQIRDLVAYLMHPTQVPLSEE